MFTRISFDNHRELVLIIQQSLRANKNTLFTKLILRNIPHVLSTPE